MSRDPEIPLILDMRGIKVVFNDSVSFLPAQDGLFRHIFGVSFLCSPQLLLHTEASVQTDSGSAVVFPFGLFISDQFLLLFSKLCSLFCLKLWIMMQLSSGSA